MPGPERKVQYEFKVIVQVPETAWPHEVQDGLRDAVNDQSKRISDGLVVVSVEQVHDGW